MPRPLDHPLLSSALRLVARLNGEGTGATLIRRAGTSFLLLGTGTGIGFLLQLFLARSLGASQFGIYIFVLTWFNILAVVAKFGLETTTVRFVAAYRVREEWGALRGLLQLSHRFVWVSSLLVALVAAGVVWQLGDRLEPELARTFWLCCVGLPLWAGQGLRASALQALRQVVRAQVPEQIVRPTLHAVLVGLLLLCTAWTLSAPVVMALNLLAILVAFVLLTVWLRQCLPEGARSAAPVMELHKWRNVTLPLYVMAGTHLLMSQVDTVTVGMLVGTTEAGIYAVAARLAQLIVFGLTAINTVAGPMISQLHSTGRNEELQRVATVTSRGILAYSLPVCLVMMVGGKFMLSLFGPSFVAGYPVLVILTLGQLVNALTGSVGLILTMTGNQLEALRILVGSAALNVLLNALLVSRWGIIGAAVATGTCIAFQNLAMAYFVWKRLGLKTTII